MAAVGSSAFDVVIAGGGAIGATLALELSHLNFSVALVERTQLSFASTSPERVIALNHGSRMHLERLGIWQRIDPARLGQIRHIAVTEPGNRGRVDMDVNDAPELSDLGYVVEMGVLLAPMYEMLDEAGIALISPAAVAGFTNDDDAVRIRVAGADGEQEIDARLLVAADGTHSPLRRMAGIETFGWDYNRFGIVASLTCERSHGEVAHECFRSSGPLAFLPLGDASSDGRYSIVWAVSPGEAAHILELDDEAFMQAVARSAGSTVMDHLGAIRATSPRASFPFELTIAKAYSAPRLALVGNAAHTIHPVAGQGMNLGLRDVATLAAVLDSELGRNDPGQTIMMQAYAEQRRLDIAAVAGFTESMVHLFGSSVPGVKWLRGIGLEKLGLARSLQDLLLRQASGLGQMEGRHAVQ